VICGEDDAVGSRCIIWGHAAARSEEEAPSPQAGLADVRAPDLAVKVPARTLYFATNFGDSCRIERIKAGGDKTPGIYASSVNPLSSSIELHDDGDGWHVFVGDMINYEPRGRWQVTAMRRWR